jgi:hypothetical protein
MALHANQDASGVLTVGKRTVRWVGGPQRLARGAGATGVIRAAHSRARPKGGADLEDEGRKREAAGRERRRRRAPMARGRCGDAGNVGIRVAKEGPGQGRREALPWALGATKARGPCDQLLRETGHSGESGP